MGMFMGEGDHTHHSPNEQAIRAELDELKAQNETNKSKRSKKCPGKLSYNIMYA
ncbi:hypothetical protein HMSSN036_00670 [Paenibacillus macerans]|nr:hypothetical protein HMSSN036_00670 [Paenibacillus macerans]